MFAINENTISTNITAEMNLVRKGVLITETHARAHAGAAVSNAIMAAWEGIERQYDDAQEAGATTVALTERELTLIHDGLAALEAQLHSTTAETPAGAEALKRRITAAAAAHAAFPGRGHISPLSTH